MRKFWFAIIDIVLLMGTSYAEYDGKVLCGVSVKSFSHLLFNSNSLFNLRKLRYPLDEEMNDDELSADEHLVGDMILSDEQLAYLYSGNATKRLGLTTPFARWPNATVFYDMDKSLDGKGAEVVIAAMNYIQNVSCVRFEVKDETTQHYVLIKSGRACTSKVGMRREGPQQMIIDGNLCSRGSVIHEFLHCLGFLHMHTANNRDDYITINWRNIKDAWHLNFKQVEAPVSMFQTEYDYDSITHYSNIAFAKDKKLPSIIAKKPAPNMGQRKGKSE